MDGEHVVNGGLSVDDLHPVVVSLAWRRIPHPTLSRCIGGTPHAELSADVLHLIAEYLSFTDRLSLSLSSKAVHWAVFRLTELVCSSEEQLSRLHAYLHAVPAVRGPRLVSLSLHFMTLPNPGDEDGGRCLIILLEVLTIATNLRSLSVDNDSRWTAVLCREPCLQAVANLRALSYLRIQAPAQDVLLYRELYPAGLRTVHLSAHDGRDISFEALCRALGHLSFLEDLTLESFPPNSSAQLDLREGITVLGSVRTLTLISAWLPRGTAQWLPNIFPKLRTMNLIHCDLQTPTWELYEFPSLHRVHCHCDKRPRPEQIISFPFKVHVLSLVIRNKDDFVVGVRDAPNLVGLVSRMPRPWWNFTLSCRWLAFESVDEDIVDTLLALVSNGRLCLYATYTPDGYHPVEFEVLVW